MKNMNTSTMFPPPSTNTNQNKVVSDGTKERARVVTLGSHVTPSSVAHSPQATSLPSPFAATGIAIGYSPAPQ